MTDSAPTDQAGAARGGKRERLIMAAARLLHEQGVEGTSLAHIAAAADVPVGNVYYYFKTKDEVIAGVIAAHAEMIKATLAAIESRHRTPKARLKALVRELAGQAESVARHGCPLGSLCSELGKRLDPSALGVAELMKLPIAWAGAQFKELGRRDAHDLAVDLLAGYEGSALLANTMREPNIMRRAARRLDQWIDNL
ncbi:MAG TPA: TetR family transcriptional regulator [Sporichthyaceae bacterium]|jgi:AcrR family transcriptional regulator|nr:TetR family transcriptional regulator [Sporichthyaceae bacterium]